jgi:hypothetical protein
MDPADEAWRQKDAQMGNINMAAMQGTYQILREAGVLLSVQEADDHQELTHGQANLFKLVYGTLCSEQGVGVGPRPYPTALLPTVPELIEYYRRGELDERESSDSNFFHIPFFYLAFGKPVPPEHSFKYRTLRAMWPSGQTCTEAAAFLALTWAKMGLSDLVRTHADSPARMDLTQQQLLLGHLLILPPSRPLLAWEQTVLDAMLDNQALANTMLTLIDASLMTASERLDEMCIGRAK